MMLANNSSIKNAAAILIIGIGALGLQCSAQTVTAFDGATPVGLAPGSPAGSYPLSGFEHHDPFSGSLNVAVPLYHVGGRGEAGFDLVWNFAQTWVAAKQVVGHRLITFTLSHIRQVFRSKGVRMQPALGDRAQSTAGLPLDELAADRRT